MAPAIAINSFDRDYSAGEKPNTITCGVDNVGWAKARSRRAHQSIENDSKGWARFALPPLRFAACGYSTPRLNLFDFGRPCARRPASARLPRQSASSFAVMLWSRPAESFQVRPALASKVVTSDNAAPVYFCSRTPRPRAISGTWSIGKITILWLVPITATL